MTSWGVTDYKANVELSKTQKVYTATILSVLIHRNNIKYPLKAMMLIFSQNEQQQCEAVIWLMTRNANITLNQTIEFELIGLPDLTYVEENSDIPQLTFPVKLTGKITSLYQTVAEQLIFQSIIGKKSS
ncbi:MAG: hypothetical protein ACSHW0_18985 [Thalassotalea sp.]